MTASNNLAVIVVLSAFAAFGDVARAEEGANRAAVANYAGQIIKDVGITPKFGEKLPLDLTFVDAEGKAVRLGELFTGKPVVVHLVYYECPMLCKLSADGLLSGLSTLSLKPGDNFTIVTISFDPREGPALSARARDLALARFDEGERDVVANGWHFLTGDEESIKAVTDAVGFRYVYDDSTKQYAHASGIFVLTADGTISRYLGGISYSPRDLRFAIVEASDGKVGTVTDQVLMLCYMYDPTVGRYGFAIMTLMRVAGLLTVATLATAIVTMIRRERRRNSERQVLLPEEGVSGGA
jgi:protein SCO1/2